MREMKDSGIEWIGEIPKDWEKCRFKYVYSINKAKLPSKLYEINDGRTMHPYMSMEYIRNEKINSLYANDGTYCKKEDILILWDGSNAGEIIYLHPEGYAPSTTAVLKTKINLVRNYSKFYLKVLESKLKENTNGMGVPHVDSDILKNLTFLLPPLEEQQQLADYLDDKVGEIDKVIFETKETIEKYKEYKQALITETVTKGLNNRCNYKSAKNEYLGNIPTHWNEKRLRFLGICQNGISKSAESFGYGSPFVSYGDVYRNYSLPKEVVGLIDSTEKEKELYSVKRGDVFFTRTSETIEEVGFTSTCLQDIKDAVFAGFVIRFRPNSKELIPEFSKYYFRSNIHRKFFVKEMNLVTRASLSQELLKKIPVLIPPLQEQQQIVEYLDYKCSKIDTIIKDKEELITKLEEYKKSLIYEAVTGKIDIQ